MSANTAQGEGESPTSVVGSRRRVPKRVGVLYLFVVLAYIVWAVVSRRVSSSIFPVVWMTVLSLSWFKPATRVDEVGVWRPVFGRRRRFIAWADVDAIERTGNFGPATVLLLVDGRRVTLADMPAARAGLVAALGGKQLRSAPQPWNPPMAASPRPLTAAQEERRLDGRVAVLAAERQRLTDELVKVRRQRSVGDEARALNTRCTPG